MSGIGKTFMGGVSHKGNVSMLTPEQQSSLSQVLQGAGGMANQSFQQFLGPQNEEDMQNIFQKSYVDPAMMAYQRNVLPSIQENFEGMNAGSSSALNQALAQSAGDLSTSLGSQYGQFREQQDAKRLQAMQLLQPYMLGHTFSPMIQQQKGLLPAFLGGAGKSIGAAGAGMMMSTKKMKENIRDYKRGLELLKSMEVKQYDYKIEDSNAKDRVGLIAEDLPQELTGKKEGLLHVDLYGLIGVLINSVKELNEKISKLEGK